jgi:ABC-type Fe3+/spermidine/putrescine transport system ATPase subunit
VSKILNVKKLSYSVDSGKIISNINLDCLPHQTMAVLGQSGSGKSTLLKLIAGLLEPDQGILTIEGQPIDPPSEKLIPGHPKIKIVKQDNPLFPNISLRENIAYELRFYEEKYRRSRVEKLLKLTGLKKVADHLPRHSSEGEQQRTAIAKAIAEEPALLLLDEPFSNLDYMNTFRMKETIKEIVGEENMACIFVTHDVADIFGMADEVAVLKSGRIVQRGTPKKVYQSPANEYVAGLTGNYNLITPNDLKLISGIESSAKQILIRPENIDLTTNNGSDAIINKQVFKGFYYELDLSIKNVVLQAITIQPLDESKPAKIRISNYHELF